VFHSSSLQNLINGTTENGMAKSGMGKWHDKNKNKYIYKKNIYMIN
jgi:hypothetical protein